MRVRGAIRLRWASLGLLMVLLGLWVFIAAFSVHLEHGDSDLYLACGQVSFLWWGGQPGEFVCSVGRDGEWNFGLRLPEQWEHRSGRGFASLWYPLWPLVSMAAAFTLWLFWRTHGIPAEVRARNPEFLRVWRMGLLFFLLVLLGAFWTPSAMVATVTIALLWREHRRPARARDRNPRLVRLRRVSVGMLLALLFLWVFSTRFYMGLQHGEVYMYSECGFVDFGLDWKKSPPFIENEVWMRDFFCDGFDLPYFHHEPPDGYRHDQYDAAIPFWLPASVVGAVTLWLYRRTRGFAEGRCHRCGYDLTANVSGVCPECGAMLEAKAAELRASVAADIGGAGK